MNDVDRLFQYLVSHLAKDAPDYLERPFQVSELYQRLIPYRYHRDGLGFDTIEDYDAAILRLLAGERGYATVEPEDAQRAMAEEITLPNPTPGAFRRLRPRAPRTDHTSRAYTSRVPINTTSSSDRAAHGSDVTHGRRGIVHAAALRARRGYRGLPGVWRAVTGRPRREVLPVLRAAHRCGPMPAVRRAVAARLALLRRVRSTTRCLSRFDTGTGLH
jgi:hypothetical protein